MNNTIDDFRNLITLMVNHSIHQFEKLNIINGKFTQIQIEKLLIDWNKTDTKLKKTFKELTKENKIYKITTNVFEIEKIDNKKCKLICFLNIDELRKLNEKYKKTNENNYHLNVNVNKKSILSIECENDSKLINLKRNEKIDLQFELIDVDVSTYEGSGNLTINYSIYGELIEIKKKKDNLNDIKNSLLNNFYLVYILQTMFFSLIIIFKIKDYRLNYIFTYTVIGALISFFTSTVIYKILKNKSY
jgi:hypothetical protein